MAISDQKRNICILGCGNGGMALAAYWSSQEHCVNLWADSHYPEELSGIKANHNQISMDGLLTCQGRVNLTTTNLKKAVAGTEMIVICLPRVAHFELFQKLVPLITEHQIIIILPGDFSCLSLDHMIKSAKKSNIILEANTFPFACRGSYNAEVHILGIKDKMEIASSQLSPTQYEAEFAKIIAPLFPLKLECYESVIQLGLECISGLTHPITTLFNAARLDNQDNQFHFYGEGISKNTVHVHEQVDKERIAIAKLYGFKTKPYYELMNELYNTKFTSIYDFFTHTKVHNKEFLTPPSLSFRYVTQDIPYVLVPWYTLGLKKNYRAKTMESIIHLFSIINDCDYFSYAEEIFGTNHQ